MLKIKSNNLPIYNFTIYGERHCGTNFLAEYIPSIYQSFGRDNDIPITWDYGWKHWFGFHDSKIQNDGSNTLFIGIIRNPYDWLYALKRIPHHLRGWNGKMNENPFINMEEFLTSEIESYHQGKEIVHDHHILKNRRYKNIFELRETKNIYLYEQMPKIASNYILINYEILHKNIFEFVMCLNNNFNLNFKQFIDNNFDKKSYRIDTNDLALINENLNWHTENKFGYYIQY